MVEEESRQTRPVSNSESIQSENPVSRVVGALAIAALNKTLEQGGTIEIPSLGITITGERKSDNPTS